MNRELDQPMNAEERFLYAIAVRLDIIVEQNNSIIEYLGSKDKVAVTTNKTVEKKVEPKKEEAKEAKPAPKKRATKKKED